MSCPVILFSPYHGVRFRMRSAADCRSGLSQRDWTLTRDFRQGIDWLGQGKFPLALFFSNSDVKAAARQGLPVDVIDNSSFKEGVPMSKSRLSLMPFADDLNGAKRLNPSTALRTG